MYTDADWNEHWSLHEQPYRLSKVLAEKCAWHLVQSHNLTFPERHVELVSLIPSTLVGPPLGVHALGRSVHVIPSLLNGSQARQGTRSISFPEVDVRDAAAAHIAAAEVSNAHGRYLVTNRHPTSVFDYVRVLRSIFPGQPIAVHGTRISAAGDHVMDNNRSVQELGLTYRSQEETIRDTVHKLVELGVIDH